MDEDAQETIKEHNSIVKESDDDWSNIIAYCENENKEAVARGERPKKFIKLYSEEG